MDNITIWRTFILPIIQYLIGPIFTGLTIWYLTNKRNLRESNEKILRQKNENIVALEYVIGIVDSINSDRDFIRQLTEDIESMKNGDFSILVEEFKGLSGDECINQYECWKSDTKIAISNKKKKAIDAFERLKTTPKDLLPEDIHLELMRYVSSKEMETTSEKYKETLNKLKWSCLKNKLQMK